MYSLMQAISFPSGGHPSPSCVLCRAWPCCRLVAPTSAQCTLLVPWDVAPHPPSPVVYSAVGIMVVAITALPDTTTAQEIATYRVLSTLNTLPVTSNRVLGEGRRVVVRSQGSLLAAP